MIVQYLVFIYFYCVKKSIDVVTNSTHNMPTYYTLIWEEPWIVEQLLLPPYPLY